MKTFLKKLFPASWKLVLLSIALGILMFFAAEFLLTLIRVISNLTFFGEIDLHSNELPHAGSYLILIIPLIGALSLGLMARYLDHGIRGHGIPEVIERIESHKSNIPFKLLWLRPIACAISIGTGGPYGAEGPVIGMGGAFGSFIGRLFKLNETEKKILLAAGAAAGISAVFGVPVGAVFLVSELFTRNQNIKNLFPIAIASLFAYIARVIFMGEKPLFHINFEAFHLTPEVLGAFGIVAIILGVTAALSIYAVEFFEDCYEKLPVHWMWWPMIGVLPLVVFAFFYPDILGPSYELLQSLFEIQDSYSLIIKLAIIKGVVWAFAVSSRTTSGTLAPLLIFGAGVGLLSFTQIAPLLGISPDIYPVAALIGAGAYFGAISGAPVSSALIVLEMTGSLSLLPVSFGTCLTAVLVTKALVSKSIMQTEYS